MAQQQHQRFEQLGATVPALHLPVPSSPSPPQLLSAGPSSVLATAHSTAAALPSSSFPSMPSTPHQQLHTYTHSSAPAPLTSSIRDTSHLQNGPGIFSTYKSQSAIRSSLKLASASRHIEGLQAGYERIEKEVARLKQQFEGEKRGLEEAVAEVEALQHALQQTEEAPVQAMGSTTHSSISGGNTAGGGLNFIEKRTRIFALQESIQTAQRHVLSQRSVVIEAQKQFEAADLVKDKYQYELSQLDELRTLIERKKEEESMQLAAMAQATEEHNERLRRKQAIKAARTEAEARAAEQEATAEALRKQQALEEYRARHAAEMGGFLRQLAEREAKLRKEMADTLARKQRNMQQLKSSTEAAQNELIAQNARRAKLLAQREARRAHERKELEGAGRNADAIFAARDEEARMAHRARRLAAEQTVRAARIQQQIEVEAKKEEKEELAKLQQAKVIQQYKRAMGHSVVDNMAASMEAARKRREDKKREEEARMVAELAQMDEEGMSDEEAAASTTPPTATPATSQPVDFDSSVSDDEVYGELGAPPSDHPAPTAEELAAAQRRSERIPGAEYTESGVRIIPNHSNPYRATLDKRKIDMALREQKEKLAKGQEKVVCGKTYAHTSKFLSDPPSIIFRDFTVGEEMRQSITLTNVSFSFNHFKILPLADEYQQVFEVLYTPVGRMSAGMSAKITIVFKPSSNRDIRTVLPLLAETGPFSIPLEAFTKKAVISVAPLPILDMGTCLLGDSCTASVTIENKGALPVIFKVRPKLKSTPSEAASNDSTKKDPSSQEEKEQPRLSSTPSSCSPRSTSDGLTPLNLNGLVVSVPPSSSSPDGTLKDSVASTPNPDATLASAADSTLPAEVTEVVPDPSRISLPPNYELLPTFSSGSSSSSSSSSALLTCPLDSYLSFPLQGNVGGYSSTHWILKFTPEVDGVFHQDFELVFETKKSEQQQLDEELAKLKGRKARKLKESRAGLEEGETPLESEDPSVIWGSPSSFLVHVTGTGSKVPIFIEQPLLDFHTCCYGKLYRSEIVLRNRHGTAHQVLMKLPRDLIKGWGFRADHIEFTPKVGYIQPHSTLKVAVKLQPDETMWRALKRSTIEGSNGGLTAEHYAMGYTYLPLVIDVADQPLPIEWALMVRMVDPSIQVHAQPSLPAGNKIVMGDVFTSESSARPITLRNPTPFVQEVAFLTLPDEILIHPARSLVIPPMREVDINVVLAPNAAIEYEIKIEAHTMLGQVIPFKVVGRGVAPPVSFRFTKVDFGPTPNENVAAVTNFVRNLSSTHRQTLQFVMDEVDESAAVAHSIHSSRSFINIRPSVIELGPAPKSSRPTESMSAAAAASNNQVEARVEMEFAPMLNLEELYAMGGSNDEEQQHQPDPSNDTKDASADTVDTLHDEKSSSASTTTSSRKKGDVSGASTKRVKSKKDQEAEQARLAAAEEELRRVEAEQQAQAAAAAAASEAARQAAAASESALRAQREARERIKPSNPLAERNLVEFSDRLQLRRPQQVIKVHHEDEQMEQDELRIDAFLSPSSTPSTTTSPSSEEVGEFLPEPWSRHARHRVAVYIRSEHVLTGEVSMSTMFLEMCTTLILPELEATPKVVAFGALAKGQAITRSIQVRNVGQHTIHLSMDSLGYSSHFSVLSALRPLDPGAIQLVVIECRPRRSGKAFKQDLVLRDRNRPNIRVTIPLTAMCIAPDLEVIMPMDTLELRGGKVVADGCVLPDGDRCPLLHLGDCLINEPIRCTIMVRNRSAYPYSFQVGQQPVPGVTGGAEGKGALTIASSMTNVSPGSPPDFFFVPSTGLIPANGGCVSLNLVFHPTGVTTPHQPFYQTLVTIGNRKFEVRAEVYERQVFVAGGRQMRGEERVTLPAAAAVATASSTSTSSSSSFHPTTFTSGLTSFGAPSHPISYPNPLSFLDGPDLLSMSVGGSALMTSYHSLMNESTWWSHEDPAVSAGIKGAEAGDKTKRGGGASSSKSKDGKKDAPGGGVGGNKKDASDRKDPTNKFLDHITWTNRHIEVEFDTKSIVELATIQPTSATSATNNNNNNNNNTGKRGTKDRTPDPTVSSPLVLVFPLQIGSCALPPTLVGEVATGSKVGGGGGGEKGADREGSGGSFEITLHSIKEATASATNNEKATQRSTSASSGAAATGEDAVLQLFSVDPSYGSLKPGTRDTVRFLFDWSKYIALQSSDPDRRLANSYNGRWIEANARITIRGGYYGAQN